MLLPRRNDTWRALVHRLCAGCTLVAYVMTILGLPISVAGEKDHSQPYPCEHHSCGCRSAAECWQHCCCFSPAERWAWARARQLEPPPNAEPVLVQGWHAPRLRDQSEGTAAVSPETSCCAKGSTTACCSTTPPATQASRSQPSGGPHWKVGVTALQCQGLATLWINTGAVLPVPVGIPWSPHELLTQWLTCADMPPLIHPFNPPDPPPRGPCL